jgi:hypothetical protein
MDSRAGEQPLGEMTTFLSAAAPLDYGGAVQHAAGSSVVAATSLAIEGVGGVSGHPAESELLGLISSVTAGSQSAGGLSKPEASAKMAQLPLSFEANVGQADASVRFLAHGPGYGLYLTGTEAVMVLSQPTGDAAGRIFNPSGVDGTGWKPVLLPEATAPSTVVCMQILGGNPTAAVVGEDQLPGKVNYFLGNDPSEWHTNIATYSKVEYRQVYPGIDLDFYGSGQGLEYDFVVAPEADAGVIRLGFSGADGVAVNAQGDLVVQAAGQDIVQHKPVVYQEVNGVRQEIAGAFVVQDAASGDALAPRGLPVLTQPGSLEPTQQVGFQLGAYDRSRPLVIDPVLSYSTYLGGSGIDSARGIAVDPTTGDALVTGWTNSTDFPTANPVQPNFGGGGSDAFVTRLSADGSTMIYSTYLGGSSDDEGNSIAVDRSTGDALVTGVTFSTDFPTAHAFQPTNRGVFNAFVARLSADGSALVNSTYLGGSGGDEGYGVAVDSSTGDVGVTGATLSTDFPTANALQPSNQGGTEAFVTRLSADGSALIYSTYLGGTNFDQSNGIALDPITGDALVTGMTSSTDFPTANALQRNYGGGGYDAFVARLRADGSALVYSTYLGGSGSDFGVGIAVDPASGDALVTGRTSSTDFPTTNAFQGHHSGGFYNAFVARVRADGSALVYSTYLRGSGSDDGFGIAVDPTTGDALVTGSTGSSDFPTANPLQPNYGGNVDAFVTRLSADGSALVYSTYLGGSGTDLGAGIAVDPRSGDVFVTGYTGSTDFPTANALQPNYGGDTDAFVTRISERRAGPNP